MYNKFIVKNKKTREILKMIKLTEEEMEMLLNEEAEKLNENNFYLKIYRESLNNKESEEYIF
jgi:hypothetical protein